MDKKIDIQKLRDLGVPEEVIAAMDIRDGGNIDQQGNVLFLDEDRQRSKEHPERRMRKNRPNGLGFRNRAARKAALEPRDNITPKFHGMVKIAQMPQDSKEYKQLNKRLGFDSDGYTYGVVLPLNIDYSEATQSTVLPIDLAFDAMEKADYIAILHTCVCRVAFGCEDYPADLGCIFINVAGRRVVELGLAKEATVEEAKAHILKAKEHGLFCNAEMVEGEQFIWGLRNDEMNEYRMFCFCCPCCCLAMKVIKHSSEENKERFHSCGYTATVNHDKCVGCGKCASICPQKAISYREDGKRITDQDKCIGCGWCKMECNSEAVKIVQTFPMRENVNEYFLKEARIDDGITAKKYQKTE